jgi:hypothetical protein
VPVDDPAYLQALGTWSERANRVRSGWKMPGPRQAFHIEGSRLTLGGDGADESAAAGGGAAQAGAPARAASRRECPGWVKRAVPDGPARSRLLHSLSANDAGQVVDSTSGRIVLMRGDVLLAIVLACIACLADNLQASADAVATEVMQHFYVSAASATWAVPTTTIRNVYLG